MSELKISSNLPDLIDNYISIRAQRLVLDKEAAQLKQTEDDLKNVIIAKFREGNITAQGSNNGLIKMKVTMEPVVMDWQALWAHIKETDQWELLHKRLTTTAVKEHWDMGETIPGVGETELYKLTVSKL